MKAFNRRIYSNLSAFSADIKSILARRDQMRPLMRGEVISPTFRERLMLAVTAVNRCRYCSYAHTKQALIEGISEDEVDALQAGIVDKCPQEELPALLYAQHWAETQGRTDPESRERMNELYDRRTFDAIELTLQTIQVGNLLGNTLDYILYRSSFGRFGA